MKAIVLAAGKGSRLYPATHHVPKPLLPIANRPTIHYIFDRLAEIGAKDICIVVGENGDAMREALGDGASLGVKLSYAIQEEPKGLAHAMACAKSFAGEDDFVMYLGDGIYSESLAPFARRFEESGCANLNIVQAVGDPTRFGIANTDGERIVKLVEKPKEPQSNLAMAGVYFFTKRIWDVLPELQPSARGEYEITDAIQLLIDKGETVLAGVYAGQWYDTGTLDSFLECSAYLLGNGALVGSGSAVMAEVGDAVCIGDDAVVRCAAIEDSTILPGAQVMVGGVIRHSIIGGSVEESGDVIGRIEYRVPEPAAK